MTAPPLLLLHLSVMMWRKVFVSSAQADLSKSCCALRTWVCVTKTSPTIVCRTKPCDNDDNDHLREWGISFGPLEQNGIECHSVSLVKSTGWNGSFDSPHDHHRI